MSQFPNQSITDFITGFNGGTRSNRFRVTGNIPNLGAGNEQGGNNLTTFHIVATSLPASIVGVIPINYRGRTVAYPGDRAYQPWGITVLDDSKTTQNTLSLYRAFHDWHENINHSQNNTTTRTDGSDHFKSDWIVEQLDTNGNNTIKKFELWHCWPSAIGSIELDMASNNTLASFSVLLYYSHYRLDRNTTR